jgi:hypothetical protein
VSIAYAPTQADAEHAVAVKAAMFNSLGIKVHICGDAKFA